jgi:hypothetical protein
MSKPANTSATTNKRSPPESPITGDDREHPVSTTNLLEYVHRLHQHYPSINGRTAVIRWVEVDEDAKYLIATSHFTQDLEVYVSKCIPHLPSDVRLERNSQHLITKMERGSEAFMGPSLTRLLINVGAGLSGMCKVIYAGDDDNRGLVVPFVNLEEWKYETARRDGKSVAGVGRKVYQLRQVANYTLSDHDVLALLRVDSIPLLCLPTILKDLSNVRKVDDEFDITPLNSLAKITSALASPDVKACHTAFLTSMQAAILDGCTMSEKIAAYQQNPDFEFFKKLKFKRPFSKQLFDSKGVPVKKIPLASLSASMSVLLQNLPYDGRYYANEFSSTIMVYPVSEYFVKRGKKLVKVSVDDSMLANELLQIASTRDGSAGSGKTVTFADKVDQQMDEEVTESSKQVSIVDFKL